MEGLTPGKYRPDFTSVRMHPTSSANTENFPEDNITSRSSALYTLSDLSEE